jgi:hypothetical protein
MTLESYLATFDPMPRAKARAALEMQVRVNGQDFMTRAALMASRVASGATLKETKHSGRVLMSRDGAFFDRRNATATRLAYAGWLINLRGETPL